jgi:hypothetical protein
MATSKSFNALGPESKYPSRVSGRSHIFDTEAIKAVSEGILTSVKCGRFNDNGNGNHIDLELTVKFDVGKNKDASILVGRFSDYLGTPAAKIDVVDEKEKLENAVMNMVEDYRQKLVEAEKNGVHYEATMFIADMIRFVKQRCLGIYDLDKTWEMLDEKSHLTNKHSLDYMVSFSNEYPSIPRIGTMLTFMRQKRMISYGKLGFGHVTVDGVNDENQRYFLVGSEGLITLLPPRLHV